MAQRLNDARARLLDVILPGEMLNLIAERIAGQNVRSLRADLAVVRGSRALAALEGTSSVHASHVEAVLPLALAHRVSVRPRDPRAEPPPPRRDTEQPEDARGSSAAAPERVFAPVDLSVPRLVVEQTTRMSGRSSESSHAAHGMAVGARRTTEPRELEPRASLLHAVTYTGTAEIRADDLHERVRLPLAGTRYLFVVDSSGSHAVQERMRVVKGAVSGLLDSARGRRDEVVVIVCRGAAASVLVEPTPVLEDAQRALEYMPTGGRTPLAHALELAATYVTDASVVVLVTDGHANVGSRSDDPWADALASAGAIRCPSLVIDSEADPDPTGRPLDLAVSMGATYVRLVDLDETSVLHLIRDAS
jgi:magnesium chelatase subunit D